MAESVKGADPLGVTGDQGEAEEGGVYKQLDFTPTIKMQYKPKDIYNDLLVNASKMLKSEGRVVFLWHTDDRNTEEENAFPSHPDFDLVCSSRDGLTKNRARHLITLQRKPY